MAKGRIDGEIDVFVRCGHNSFAIRRDSSEVMARIVFVFMSTATPSSVHPLRLFDSSTSNYATVCRRSSTDG